VAAAAAGLAIIATFGERWTRMTRLVALALSGAGALAIFGAIEPRCLRGPFGLIDRSIFHLWLDNVSELQGLASLFRAAGLQALVHIGFPIVAALSVVAVVRAGLRTPLAWAPIAAFAIAAVIAAGQIRMMVYVIWIGVPFVGAAIQHLAERTSRPFLVRIGGAAFGSPPAISLMILSAVSAFAEPSEAGKPKPTAQWAVDTSACFRPELYRAVATLPTGVVMGPLEVGPSVLAHTSHSVIAAPYHRADRAIRFNEEVMNAPSAVARARLVERGVDYVVTCAEFPNYAQKGSFFNALLADSAGPWLEPIAMPEGNILKVWRVVRRN
jgi:hypothetical protein